MKKPKTNEQNTQADIKGSPSTDNPFSNVLKSGEVPKLGVRAIGTVIYEIAQNSKDQQLYFRIAGQSGGAGLHSKHWIQLSQLLALIESQGDKPWKSQLYKELYEKGSANNQGFCAAIVRGLGLATRAGASMYQHVVSEKYQENRDALLLLVKDQQT
ncbi:hypothetical protein ACOMICROBIO_GDFFDHBD_00104 [Vibrio sp. B1REV9]|uniref:hypothetical protein n=1 Tax=Vibrio sp. B1REV9 TaxID=2751179 RepID=UPI001AF11DB0|nr:hypothetical protein [Vibrio sp. B1REV9]CAE6879016.1 hypothetical protein ACOMICROBIO_GDFFDHBD_00104 [Vibrio sp. B1REV9]